MPYYKFDESRPIEVYFNLHRKEFSIRQDGLVVQHLSYLDMQDVTFHVQPAGNARVRKEMKKNVHAYVKGKVACDYRQLDLTKLGEITYNPYKYKNFVWKESEEPVSKAEYISLDADWRVDADSRKAVMTGYKKNY